MQRKLLEHIGSIAFVSIVFFLIILFLKDQESSVRRARAEVIEPYLHLPFVDFGNPRDRALFRETLDLFRPGSRASNDSLMKAIESYRQARFTDPEMKSGGSEHGLSWPVLQRLAGMYFQFIFVYAVVLGLTFFAAQTLAMVRFVRMKQGRGSYWREFLVRARASIHPMAGGKRRIGWIHVLVPLVKALGKGVAYAVLFSPAYVIGYALRANVEIDSVPFMILLGAVSNGLLVNYANKFYTLLVAESRKGYVETALVKSLSGDYTWNSPEGVSYRSLVRIPRRFPGHVFEHIYLNARYQYFPTLKEQASFLITGLIIIEMALNIQGHLCYELLQNILYRRYDIALTIILGIFLLIKVTEILVDLQQHRKELRFENRG
jgi:hypothetical protein